MKQKTIAMIMENDVHIHTMIIIMKDNIIKGFFSPILGFTEENTGKRFKSGSTRQKCFSSTFKIGKLVNMSSPCK